MERRTANFTTWSSEKRILEEGAPYVELVFKAAPDGKIKLRLEEYIRSRGYGIRSCGGKPWLTVTTQERGSYRECDVLSFLEKHLPEMSPGRDWRIILADDFSAHKTENVFRLCWNRGYVLLIHGGAATSVAQTVDTDLNQHVKREYVARESQELIRQARMGAVMPSIKKETSIDVIVEVLSNRKLHLDAAKGYKRTGASICLEGKEDHEVCREAGEYFRGLGMREKINREVAAVRGEARAGRLRWTRADVLRLIQPYPKHKRADAILDRMAEHTYVRLLERE